MKVKPVQQVMLEVTVASIDRSAIPDATYRWAKKQLGLTGENVGFSVPKNRDSRRRFCAGRLQSDGFVKLLETRGVITPSGRAARTLSICGSNMQTIASGEVHPCCAYCTCPRTRAARSMPSRR